MPRYAEAQGLPAEMEPFIEITSANRGRLAVLWHIHQHPGATRTATAEATGISLQATRVHLDGLEQAGAIHADVPPEERHGRTVHYTADVAAVLRAIEDLRRRFAR